MASTKGPWKVREVKRADWSIYGADGYSITAISYDDVYGRPMQDEANIYLMAAAPELLAALENLVARFSIDDYAVDGECTCLQFEDHGDCRHLIAVRALEKVKVPKPKTRKLKNGKPRKK